MSESAAPLSDSPSDSSVTPMAGGPLYSLVAWPPQALDTWLRRHQARLGVSGFGAPHLNLRSPFSTPLSNEELVARFRELLRDQSVLSLQIKGWKQVPGVIFLEFERSAPLFELHRRVLEVGPSSRSPYDGEGYLPHLTLALGVLPWAAEELWADVQSLEPPLQMFEIEALSLTREERGEVQELHTYPLRGAEPRP